MSTKTDYENFLAWLHARPGVPDDVKRVANAIHTHFDRIERTSSNQGQRARTLVPLLKQDFQQISPALPAIAAGPQAQTRDWVKLGQIVVGPFRGFRVRETFDLSKRVVLFYGQNGTGKTSLCEAMEHALLRTVEEAAVKRINPNDYLKNVHARAFVAPQLSAMNAQGMPVPVQSSADAYRFCFVEKNRIEDFSRMSSKTPALRTELIAALFGMQGFSDFVQNFNADISDYLTLIPRKGNELANKRQQLAADNALVAGKAERRHGWDVQEQALATELRPEASVDDLYLAIGTEAAPGRLQELEQRLIGFQRLENGTTLVGIQNSRHLAEEARRELAAANAALDARRADVNFKSLYEALQGLEQENLDHCPACMTPLEGTRAVVQNPFDRARQGLAQLAALAALQRQQTDAQAKMRRAREILGASLLRLSSVTVQNLDTRPFFSLFHEGQLHEGELTILLDAAIEPPVEGQPASAWAIAEELARGAETLDAAIRQENAERQTLLYEKNRLQDLQRRADALATLRTQLISDVVRAETNIANFNVLNAALIADVESERQTIDLHRPIDAAYTRFRELLREYREQMPQALTANLSELTRELFNAFNRYDGEGDKLARLILPVNAGGHIAISFNSHPGELHDALQVLSEGHIRCLGLSILVAKNIQQQCPLLIFDDAVNAIDDEHRLGIRDTLFDNPAFAQKQLVITCHGEEMIKDIENALDHQQAATDCVSYTFLPHEGDRIIRVIAGATRNYILEAKEALRTGRTRAALGHARRATEAVTARTWKFLRGLNQGELRLKMERHHAPVELHDLATQLKKNIDANAFQHVRKTRLVSAYAAMLEPRYWAVINAGTHEEAGRTEFPREIVQAVVDNLAMIDEILSGRHDQAARAV